MIKDNFGGGKPHLAYVRIVTLVNYHHDGSNFIFPCTAVNCGSLNNPSNGKVSVNGSTFRSVATYKCKSGFSLVGDKQRICQSNGKWSRNAPTCKRK